jgi:hypothetical protein
MTDREQLISKQVERWDLFARLVPTAFLLISLVLILFDVIDFETAFYVGIVGFATTAVVWWWWALFTLRHLVITLNRASKNLNQVNQDIVRATKEIEALKNGS